MEGWNERGDGAADIAGGGTSVAAVARPRDPPPAGMRAMAAHEYNLEEESKMIYTTNAVESLHMSLRK